MRAISGGSPKKKTVKPYMRFIFNSIYATLQAIHEGFTVQAGFLQDLIAMQFPERIVALRKEKNLTQQALADKVEVHLTQIQRYESGAVQPTLDVIRRLAIALSVSADMLIFDKDERGPDEDLKLQFEAISRMSKDEKKIIKALLDGMILKHEAQRWSTPAS
jgi:transcriptional regulator with XRE-family HTH domain